MVSSSRALREDVRQQRPKSDPGNTSDQTGFAADAVEEDGPAPWLSTDQAARTLYRMIDSGELPAYRFGRVIRLRRHEVEEFVDRSRVAPGTLQHLYKDARANSAPREADWLETEPVSTSLSTPSESWSVVTGAGDQCSPGADTSPAWLPVPCQ